MKNKEASRRNNILAALVYLSAFLISIKLYTGLVYDVLGIAFLMSFLYGIICVYDKKKFVF